MTTQLPAYLANRQRRDLASQASGGIQSGQGPHISIKDNRFTLVDAAGNERPIQMLYLDVCIIDANPVVSKIFFDPSKKYDPAGGDNGPPLCFSDNGIGASASAAQPQNTSCQLCQWNAWGSAQSQMTGKQTKACNDVKKLAVVVPGLPDQVFMLRIPPATLKNLKKYTDTLGGHGVDLPDVLTRLEFESQGVLKFNPVGYVDEATARASDAILAAKGTEALLGKQDRVWGGVGDAQKLAYAHQQQQGQLSPPPTPQPPTFVPSMPPPPPGYGNAFPAGPAAPPPSPPTPQAAPQEPPPARRTRGPNKPKAAPVDANAAPPFVTGPAPAFAPSGSQAPAAAVPIAASPSDNGIPTFLQRTPDNQPVEQAPPPGPAFGMHPNPPAPDAGMQAALEAAGFGQQRSSVQDELDAAFRLPT